MGEKTEREKRISGIFTPNELKKRLEEEYDKGAWTYDQARFTYPGGIYIANREQEAILSNLKPFDVLEIGCGTARHGPPIEFLGYNYTGIDISEKMLEEGAKKGEWLRLYKMDAENMEFHNEMFDTAFMVRVFRTLPNSKRAIKGAHRVLRKGGRLIIIYESKSNPLQRMHHWFTKKYMGNPCNYYTNEEMRKLFEDMGFKVTKIGSVINIPFFYKVRSQFLVNRMAWFDRRLNNYNRAVIVGEKI